jgi:transposase
LAWGWRPRLVRDQLCHDPLSGHLFLFANKTKTRLKALVWDGSGLWVCAKRLEKGRFRWPEAKPQQRAVTMRSEELAMLVNGLDLKQTRQRNWYRKSA